jgi:pimeloyl-ACP methyl ester carboxylesterase
MVQASRIAAVLIAASLSGCGGLTTGLDLDSTASLDGSSKSAGSRRTGDAALLAMTDDAAKSAPEAPPSARPSGTLGNSLFARAAVEAKPIDPVVTPVAAKSTETVKPLQPSPRAEVQMNQPRGRAYLFRGVAGLIYSTGMDRLADRINHAGLPASVDTYLVWRGVAAEAIREYRRNPFPIILIGHSMGGDAAVAFAETLHNADIPVSLLVTYDPTRIADAVPPNVERYINIYQSWNVMGGGDVVGGRGFHGHYASINLADHGEIIHINIEKADRIQEQLVAKIVQLTRTPTTGQGEVVPIRYAVPGRAPIELWDSGVPVTAQAGDTLQGLATTYRVPIWALAQINRMPEQATFTGGERIIVPRNLSPTGATAALSYAPASR